MTKFKVANIHCENCANTIKNALGDEYGEIKVDLGVEPRVVSVNLDGKDEAKFKELAAKYGLSLMRLGISGGEAFRINSVRKNLKALKEIYFGEFAKIVKSED